MSVAAYPSERRQLLVDALFRESAAWTRLGYLDRSEEAARDARDVANGLYTDDELCIWSEAFDGGQP